MQLCPKKVQNSALHSGRISALSHGVTSVWRRTNPAAIPVDSLVQSGIPTRGDGHLEDADPRKEVDHRMQGESAGNLVLILEHVYDGVAHEQRGGEQAQIQRPVLVVALEQGATTEHHGVDHDQQRGDREGSDVRKQNGAGRGSCPKDNAQQHRPASEPHHGRNVAMGIVRVCCCVGGGFW